MNLLKKVPSKVPVKELLLSKEFGRIEAGIDESGAGCLAGDVIVSAVIWPSDITYFEQFEEFEEPGSIENNYEYNLIKSRGDSKKLTEKQRNRIRSFIEEYSIDYSFGRASVSEIDEHNILHARVIAMNRAIKNLSIKPEYVLIDGNYFYHTPGSERIPFETVEKGDSIYQSIACASILAKTERDNHILELHKIHPNYKWDSNKSYGTKEHYTALRTHGPTEFHRKSFRLS